jgi:imidazolonepropionase-like amidohydrolase
MTVTTANTKSPARTTYFRVGRLIIGDGRPPQADMLLIVEDDYIRDVLPAQAADPNLDFVDYRAYTILPGLIDTHTHIMAEGDASRAWSSLYFDELLPLTTLKAAQRAANTLRMGFTTLRDLGSREYLDIALRDAIQQGLVPGPRLFVAGVPLTSTGGHFDGLAKLPGITLPGQTGLFNSPDEARAVARYQVKMGVDWLKIAIDGRRRNVFATAPITHQEMSPAEIRAVCEVAEWAGIHVAAHSDGGAVMRDAAAAGVRTIEHIQDLSRADADLLAAHDAYLIPTLTATYNTVEAGQLAADMDNRTFGFFVENWEAKQRGMANALAAGVKLALGTDAGYRFCRHGENAKELPLLVETGMTPMQALVAATGRAAQALGLDHLLGTLSPGKLADFVVINGDPLADVRLLTQPAVIVDVYKGGRNLAAMGLHP